MKKITLFFATFLMVASNLCFATGNLYYNSRSVEVRFIKDNHRLPDIKYQYELRHAKAWQNFLTANGTWFVLFNEENAKPHRAFGNPISVSGITAQDKALNFINSKLGDMAIPTSDLVFVSAPKTEKNTFIHFKQSYQGLDVLYSSMIVKLNANNQVIMFGADVYNDIDISTIPVQSVMDAANSAQVGITDNITSVVVTPSLMVLSVPVNKKNEYHLVYEVWVKAIDDFTIPSNYHTFIDASTGEILFRRDMVWHFSPPPANVEVTTKGTVYTTHSYNPSTFEVLPNLDFSIGATNYTTDGFGYALTSSTSAVTGNFSLAGSWSTVFTGSTTPTFSSSLSASANTVSFDTDANIRERTAYYHVNRIHDYHKTILTSFTGMDLSLPTNLDLSGSCNAFYDGSSINFYQADASCVSFATVGDVVYHEYGHGINDKFYQSLSSFFNNGAMGEGYADVWGYSENEDPLLGDGTDATDPSIVIRRYDIDPKVYPVDLVGEVHADGEIIAGAWWDTYVNLGNDMPATMNLFALAYPGLQATAADGNEGQAFTDVLLDVLQADDDNGNILDGTPNGSAIYAAFALHGITLLSNADLVHTAVETGTDMTDIAIDADLTLTFPWTNYLQNVQVFYKVNNSPTWNAVTMSNVGGNTYAGMIPGQPNGTIIPYYIGAVDIFGYLSAVKPIGAAQPDPNIPYFILVGYDFKLADDMDFYSDLGSWDLGVPGDNATTGVWEVNIPIGSFATPGDPSTIVAPDYQHTPSGTLCFSTQEANTSSDPIGQNDVDAGSTTLRSASIDLSSYSNPAVSYYRWYINNPPSGANPGADWWQVYVSDNGGSTWISVENTLVSDRSWRKFAFRVQDYVGITNNFKIKYIASDSTHLGQYLDGGSLIEAAVDDVTIWDETLPQGVDEQPDVSSLSLFPNPAVDELNLRFISNKNTTANIQVINNLGEVVVAIDQEKIGTGIQVIKLPIIDLASGNYMLFVVTDSQVISRKLNVVK